MLCRRAKYSLQHVVRTHLAENDAAYNCVYEMEDGEGNRGVRWVYGLVFRVMQ